MLAVFLQPLLGMLCPRSSGWFFLVFWVSCQIPPSQCSFSWLFSWIVHDHGITLLPFLPLSMFLPRFVSFCPKSSRFTWSGNSSVFITVPAVLAHSSCVINNCWVKKRITILKQFIIRYLKPFAFHKNYWFYFLFLFSWNPGIFVWFYLVINGKGAKS